MDPAILSKAKRPDILEQLTHGNFPVVIQLINGPDNNDNGFWRFIKGTKAKNDAGFAYAVLNSCLLGQLEPTNYSQRHKLDFQRDFVEELAELFRVLLTLEYYQNAPNHENQIACTLLETIRDGALYTEKNSNDYPTNSINAKVWMDGAGLRVRADELSEYFKRKRDDHKELDALFLKAKLTTTIMSHYPNDVGPDMIAVALKFEALGNKEKAKSFYTPVVLDFTNLTIEIGENLNQSSEDTLGWDLPVVQSLIDSLEGLKRLGETIDEELLIRSKEILNELRKLQ